MNAYQTLHFGVIQYLPDQIITFPAGLPAFEEERQFIPVEQPATSPVVFLQSLGRPDLVFITLPISMVDPSYCLTFAPEDLEFLGLPADHLPEAQEEVICLAIVTVPEGKPPTANLMAPIVVNRKNRCALQVIQSDSTYSHQQHLSAKIVEGECS